MVHSKLSIVVIIMHVERIVLEIGFKVVIPFTLDDIRCDEKKKTSNHDSEIVLK